MSNLMFVCLKDLEKIVIEGLCQTGLLLGTSVEFGEKFHGV